LINDMFITHDDNMVILNNVVDLKGVLCHYVIVSLQNIEKPNHRRRCLRLEYRRKHLRKTLFAIQN